MKTKEQIPDELPLTCDGYQNPSGILNVNLITERERERMCICVNVCDRALFVN